MTSAGQHLRTLAHRHLNERECAALKQAIQSFRQTKSVLVLCTTLRSLLNTQEKTCLLEAIFPMIPEDLRLDFDHLCCLNFQIQKQRSPEVIRGTARHGAGRPKRKSSAKVLLPVEQIRAVMGLEARSKAVSTAHQKEVRRTDNSPSKRADFVRMRRDSSRSSEGRKEHKRSRTMDVDLRRNQPEVPPLALNTSSEQQQGSSVRTTPKAPPSSTSSSASAPPIQIRKIKLTHREKETLGFSIRGGKDLNAGIYVSTVDPGGQAERHGLKVGERILKVNDTPFKSITHAQAVVALKSARRLILYVAPVGTMPGSTPNGTPRSEISSARSASSHQSLKSASSSKHGNSSHDNSQDEADGSKVKQVTIIADEDGWLGCSIRGGVDFELDVTVANVDPMSPAYRAGLKRGLLISKVNGVSVETLTHEEIISLVMATNVVVLDVKPAPKKSSQNQKSKVKHRRSQTAEAALPSPRPEERSQPSYPSSSAQSPKQTGRLAANFAEFELELQSTPPVSTSTPLPPDNHPALIANREKEREALNNNLSSPEDDGLRAISPDPTGRFVRILNDSRDLDGSGGSSTENTPREGSKFDMGTIRLNMANQMEKTLNVLGNCNRTPTKKEHVKDIFHLNSNMHEYRTPVSSPKPDRNAKSGLNTPEMNPYIRANMNILSSPYNNVEQELRLANFRPSTPSKQLPIMKPLVNSQVDQQLTGKRAKPPLCPNIPVAQTSPVSKFFKKMLRRNSMSGSRRSLGSLRSTSMESLNDDKTSLNSLGAVSSDGSAMHRSAYDLMVENDPDVTLL
ncbi:uncharacterized protein LOC119737415 isoform X2 [Patiria miniata]|uniref:PDZ domain-containing protein n=1 Tax=Patiria miniata TaxID=46514 RepID=A0A914AV97_PATMI|nr:uncharacterized protein LOC119737415 isoform X2 [Patiria miniata]